MIRQTKNYNAWLTKSLRRYCTLRAETFASRNFHEEKIREFFVFRKPNHSRLGQKSFSHTYKLSRITIFVLLRKHITKTKKKTHWGNFNVIFSNHLSNIEKKPSFLSWSSHFRWDLSDSFAVDFGYAISISLMVSLEVTMNLSYSDGRELQYRIYVIKKINWWQFTEAETNHIGNTCHLPSTFDSIEALV